MTLAVTEKTNPIFLFRILSEKFMDFSKKRESPLVKQNKKANN